MKYIFALCTIVLAFCVIYIQNIYAHPGATSWDGCHFCRSNCGRWGYTYNTRHCHNGEVPQFGRLDPLYYYEYTDYSYEAPESGQDKCDRKYPGTTYNYINDQCKCSNGNEYSSVFKCEKPYCPYSDGTRASIGDISLQGNKCTKSGWDEPPTKQIACDRKYPGTIYKKSGDKCVCANGESWTSYWKCI